MAGQGISDLIDIWIYNQKEESAKKKLETFDGRKGVKAVIIDGELIYYGNEPVIEVIMEETSGENPKPTTRGYIKKSTFDAMNVTTVSIPATFAGLEAEMMPPRLQYQLFRIVNVVENEDYVEVTARHVWYDNLKNYTLWEVPKANKDTDYTAAAVCRNIMTNAISPTGSRVASDCKDTLKGSQFDYKNKNLVEAFLDPENGVCAKFGLSMLRNNWDFYCLKNVGYDRGFVIENGKNLLGVERTESIENLATRVAPFGKTKKGDIVWLDYNGKKYIDSQYIGDYSCPHVELYDTGIQIGKDGVTAQNIQQKLLEAAQKRFTDDHVDIPEVEMTIEFISLGDTEEYAQYRGLDKVYLYDILHIRDTVRGYEYSAQVVGVEHDILTGMLNSVTIGKLDNWDGTRKIATWQVPEVNGENIRLLSIQAGAFAPGAIGSDDLQEAIIQYAHFASATIDALSADSIEAVTAHIHEIIAGSITADDITAGSITTETLAAGAVTAEKIAAEAVTSEKIHAEAITAGKIAAGAVTTEKLDAGAVTAAKIAAGAITTEKLAADAITADKIAANGIDAINAKLGTATIANGYISNANIDYARVKDISADEAIITTSITEQGVADRLYINRLQITYGQMVAATIGDLVIGDSNGDYYHIDVEWDDDGIPTLVPTQVTTPSAEEIEAGHTSDGKTIIGDVGTFAELSSEDFYAINGVIDRITAKRIDVDELWARQAFIGKLMTTDISSNTYIQATIGNWQSGSTITQTINSLNSRISELGYGTIYYSETEPSHSGLVRGDVWIQPIEDRDWDDVDEFTWDELDAMTWDQIEGQYRMYSWTGTAWKLLFDNLFTTEIYTEINQLAYAITLKANQSAVDLLSGQVTDFGATLELQSQQISAAVATVNAKASSFIQFDDPSEEFEIHLGDTWTRNLTDGTWDALDEMTWDELDQYTWDELTGSATFVWDGTEWIPTSDYAVQLDMQTLVTQTAEKLEIESTARMELGDQVTTLSARLIVTNNAIEQEVIRAQTAENSKIAKTSQYQTADDIVTAAQAYVNGILTDESAISQSATGITAYVSHYVGNELNGYYEIRSGIDILAAGVEISGAKYIKIKSGGLFSVESGNFSVDASGNVVLNGTVTAGAGSVIGGWSLLANRLYSGSGAGYVALDSDPNGTYAIWAGNATAASAAFWVKRDGTAKFSGTISAASGSMLGGWTLGANDLHSGLGSSYIALASSGTYAMWAGAENSASAPFRLKPDGSVYLTSLVALSENGSETTVNLRTAGLWKLSYNTIKSYSVSGGYCTAMTLTNGTTVNFKHAAAVYLTGSWSGSTFTVTETGSGETYSETLSAQTGTGYGSQDNYTIDSFSSSHYAYGRVYKSSNQGGGVLFGFKVDATSEYNAGWASARSHQVTVGTCYEITAHQGEWVKVREIGTGYSRVGATPQ
ncbi:MAG: phage tail protein [Bacteroidales bacterium]|nr:phage tail protein [Bacteroidales bacterium]